MDFQKTDLDEMVVQPSRVDAALRLKGNRIVLLLQDGGEVSVEAKDESEAERFIRRLKESWEGEPHEKPTCSGPSEEEG